MIALIEGHWLLLLPEGGGIQSPVAHLMSGCHDAEMVKSPGGVSISQWEKWSQIDVFFLVEEEGLIRPVAVTIPKYLNPGIKTVCKTKFT